MVIISDGDIFTWELGSIDDQPVVILLSNGCHCMNNMKWNDSVLGLICAHCLG